MDQKRVFIVGGTGFLGVHAAREFLKKGWSVTALGLPPAPPSDLLAASVNIVLCDLDQAADETLVDLLKDHEALVFAAGLDDRITPTKPAYQKFMHANVEVCERVLTLAHRAGVSRAVLLGSYFAHFSRLWPELRLVERHPYIRSRVEQERLAAGIPGLSTCVLELPYIFGDTHGHRPLWYPLVKYIRSTRLLFYPKGGSACITAETVGQAVVGACENGQPGKCYPIGDENLSWPDLLKRLAAADERSIRVITLPTWLVKIALYGVWLIQLLQRKESGLDPRYLGDLQTANTYLDPGPSREELGYQTGGLDRALQQTIEACS